MVNRDRNIRILERLARMAQEQAQKTGDVGDSSYSQGLEKALEILNEEDEECQS